MINRSVEDINSTLDNLISRIEKLEWFKKEVRHDIDILEGQTETLSKILDHMSEILGQNAKSKYSETLTMVDTIDNLKKEIKALCEAVICVELNVSDLKRTSHGDPVIDAIKWREVDRKPLDRGEILKLSRDIIDCVDNDCIEAFARAIEQAHGIGN
jgi:hypothetical protein